MDQQQLTDSDSPNSLNKIQPSISPSSSHHRSILTIDLNQIPSPPETPLLPSPTTLVRSFHDNPSLPAGPAASIPSGDSVCWGCGCGGGGDTDRLVCDGCERGFHYGCAGVNVELVEDWLCRECLQDGVSSRRWRLGRIKEDTGFRLLDMNVSPPRDGDVVDSRKAFPHGNAYNGYGSSALLSYPNSMYSGNGFGFQKPSSVVKQPVGPFQDGLHSSRSVSSCFEDIGNESQLGKVRNSNTALRLPSLSPGEVLQSLKGFVSERHGVLEEGWRVEFRQSKNGFETFAVYCAPNGMIFETMSDVASYLGLASIENTMEPDLRNEDGSALRISGLHLPKRRKLTKLPIGNGFLGKAENLTGRFNNGVSSHPENGHFSVTKHEQSSAVVETVQEEVSDTPQFHEGLPLQYEDFFVLSLGKIDTRAGYHNTCQISPVGYRSCWHDKITGSLFLCDVLDDCDSGPVFKVRRFSCSALPVPYGTTILQGRSCGPSDVPQKKEINQFATSDEEFPVEMILSEPCFPVEGDSLSWLLSTHSEIDCQKANRSNFNSHSPVGECIGEISADGNSPSQVWSILSKKIADACRQIFKQSGCLKLYCKHANEGISSLYDTGNDRNVDMLSSLHKFCNFLGSLKVPPIVESDDELEPTMDALKYWLDSDRFGLDVDFVQELIEQCPDVERCSQYESLKRRKSYLKAPLVQNGLLLINGKSIEQCQQYTVIDSLYKSYRSSRELARVIHSRPQGKHFGENLPPYLVGDVLQVWGLLFRFSEILSLEPLTFHGLEAELLSPWFENLYLLGSCEGNSSGGQSNHGDGQSLSCEQSSSSSGETDQLEEETHAKINLSNDSKCAGLRRAHMSIIDVIVSELQIKVAAMVDPSIDGESKSRRGRRKDVDSSILAIRTKLNLLPINELTWPELARRYILAVLSMDGNLDSAETGMRECGKVFRCLQGDGGVLCGSLVGVAGIEADALLLAEATKQIYGYPASENDCLTLEDDSPDPVIMSEVLEGGDGNIPAWAQALEPVKKLPTNVGTRIRKCVNDALTKDPPDWARKRLEQSISKEVYKGNASGPTKKAVLSVLLDRAEQASQQKMSMERKTETIVSLTDIVMRKCRILLRRAAVADNEKVFCNLLGRNLLSIENDDEGLLGTPAMVSRPLDFRTIDLRLAVGVYRGSHEAFLEDVQELWKNISIAHADQPELGELAETLSKNFETLYQDEVVVLVGKLKEYSKMDKISPEAKAVISDVLASVSNIPKAPWDEGVCKVCGVDKDDDSVLLCDTCDAEYHTYCLDPPLARIPEGNWYCPSCVSGVNILPGTSKGAHLIGRQRRRNHGEGIRDYLEELGCLSSVMQQKDYWEFSIDERISLLKFLCDEVLNSIIVRQHLERCFETSADLQPKLRTLFSEWRSFKLREDILAAKVAKLGPHLSNVTENSSLEGNVGKMADQSICEELQPVLSDRCDYNTSISGNSLQANRCNLLEKNTSFNSQVQHPRDSDCQMEDIDHVANESTAANPLLHEPCGKDSESSCHGKIEDEVTASCAVNGEATRGVPCSTSNELQSFSDELKAVQKDLSSLQQSIASVSTQLLKSSLRLEYLGVDSLGRLYWGYAQEGVHPWVIVDGTMALEPKKQGVGISSMMDPAWSVSDRDLSLGGSSTACPFVYGSGSSYPTCSQWVYYQSESEVRELVKSLNDYDPKERELKDAIRHSQKLKIHELQQPGKQDQVPPKDSMNSAIPEVPILLVTKASNVLEGKYGRFSLGETIEAKKRRRRSGGTNDEELCRCKCLEPVWNSRHHCRSCHTTFCRVDELRAHNNKKCCLSLPESRKVYSGITSGINSVSQQHIVAAREKGQAHMIGGSKLSKMAEFQNKGLFCPYDLDEISSKFITNDSIKELVSEIGLIGSEGTTSFVPSMSLYLTDPTLMFKESIAASLDQMKTTEKAIGQSRQILAESSACRLSQNNYKNSLNGQRRKKFGRSTLTSPMVVESYCTVPESSLKPVGWNANHILRQLKICLLDMEAALSEGCVRLLKADPDKRSAWRAFVKAADTIFQMVQATIVLEDMIKTDHLKNEWWYWSSLSAAVQTSTLSALALRIFALDNAIVYDTTVSDLTRAGSFKSGEDLDQQSPSALESSDKSKQGRRSSRRRKDADG